MKASTFQLWCVNSSIIFSLLAFSPARGEVIADETLPINTKVTPLGNIKLIEEGTLRDRNLFHSFKEFSIESGNTVRFIHDAGIQNIITRVTGGSISNIDGIIQTLINGTTNKGNANLFMINPSGIVFGQDATLDIGGSFIGSTADSIKFVDGTEFSAVDTETPPLLTVNVPLGLQFGSNSGDIINRSQANPNETFNNVGLPPGLQVSDGKTLALVGGNLLLEGGNLTAREGRIELGSVAGDGFVNVSNIATGFALGYESIQNFGDITLSQEAAVDTSGEGGGAIQVQGKNINLTEFSIIFADTEGSISGQNLVINASESVKLSGGAQIGTFGVGDAKAGDVIVNSDSIELLGSSPDGDFPSSFASQVFEGRGDGGNIIIETRLLTIEDGATIDASTFGEGNAGNVTVKASDGVKLLGTNQFNPNPSGIFAQVANGAIDNPGDAGNITIDTTKIAVEAGAQISSAARQSGNGGNVNITASDFITLTGSSPTATLEGGNSGIFATAEPGGTTGNPGNLNITTRLLTVENGSTISANNRGSGQQPGSLTLNVDKLLIRDGGLVETGTFDTGPGGNLTVNAKDSVEVSGIGTDILGEDIVKSTLFTQAESSGNAGNLSINTPRLRVKDGAEVTVSSTDTGAAGNLEITADRIELDNRGQLVGTTLADADAGNITLNIEDFLLLRRQSTVSTSAGTANAPGNGGDIAVNAPDGFIVAVPDENSNITANAFSGSGGRVTINATGIFGIASLTRDELINLLGTDNPAELDPAELPTNVITAISQQSPNLSGEVSVITPDVDPSRGLIQLPSNLVDASQKLDNACKPGSQYNRSSFIITGRGGLPPNPREVLTSQKVDVGWVSLDRNGKNPTTVQVNTQNIRNINPPENKIVEAQRIVVDKNGDIFLAAEAPTVNPLSSRFPSTACAGN